MRLATQRTVLKMKKRKKIAAVLADTVIIAAGTALFSAALTVFLIPSDISPGGVTGLATIISSLTRLPAGVLTLALNLPLFIWGWLKIGSKFIVKTIAATTVMSVWIDLFTAVLPAYRGDRLLASLYGGFMCGIGLALIFLRGSSTGGTDIAAKIISARFPRFSIGKMVMMLDAVVILCAAVAYRSFETALYTTLTIFISSKAIDGIVYGADKGKLVFIVTSRPDEIKQALYSSIRRGVTVISARGGYSGSSNSVLMCAVRINEAARLHRAVSECDKSAFMIMTEAGEISGEGFARD